MALAINIDTYGWPLTNSVIQIHMIIFQHLLHQNMNVVGLLWNNLIQNNCTLKSGCGLRSRWYKTLDLELNIDGVIAIFRFSHRTPVIWSLEFYKWWKIRPTNVDPGKLKKIHSDAIFLWLYPYWMYLFRLDGIHHASRN